MLSSQSSKLVRSLQSPNTGNTGAGYSRLEAEQQAVKALMEFFPGAKVAPSEDFSKKEEEKVLG
jgi:hypothetical protein